MGTVAKDRDPVTYLTASGLAALINFPLWKAAAIGQSGFASQGTPGPAQPSQPGRGDVVVHGRRRIAEGGAVPCDEGDHECTLTLTLSQVRAYLPRRGYSSGRRTRAWP